LVTWLAPMVNLRPWAVAGYEFSPSKLCKPAQEFETLTQALQNIYDACKSPGIAACKNSSR